MTRIHKEMLRFLLLLPFYTFPLSPFQCIHVTRSCSPFKEAIHLLLSVSLNSPPGIWRFNVRHSVTYLLQPDFLAGVAEATFNLDLYCWSQAAEEDVCPEEKTGTKCNSSVASYLRLMFVTRKPRRIFPSDFAIFNGKWSSIDRRVDEDDLSLSKVCQLLIVAVHNIILRGAWLTISEDL